MDVQQSGGGGHAGILQPGFCPMLEPLFGSGAFDDGGHRLAVFTARVSGLGNDLRECWSGMRATSPPG